MLPQSPVLVSALKSFEAGDFQGRCSTPTTVPRIILRYASSAVVPMSLLTSCLLRLPFLPAKSCSHSPDLMVGRDSCCHHSVASVLFTGARVCRAFIAWSSFISYFIFLRFQNHEEFSYQNQGSIRFIKYLQGGNLNLRKTQNNRFRAG